MKFNIANYLIIFFSVNTIISIVLAILLAKDAQKRGMKVGVWGGLTCLAGICSSLFGWIGMTLIYFLIRQPVEVEPEEGEDELPPLTEQKELSHQPQYLKSGDIDCQPVDDVVFQRSEAPTAETAKSTLPVDAISSEPDADIQPSVQQDDIYDEEEDADVAAAQHGSSESFEPPDNVSLKDEEPDYEPHIGELDESSLPSGKGVEEGAIDMDDDMTAMLEAADEPALFARLFVTVGPDKGKEFTLPTDEGERVLIGRRPPSDIIITDKTVSGEHALIKVDGGEYRLSDQASKHGTFICEGGKVEEDNKERVEQSISLKNNDVIEVGKSRLVFVIVPPPILIQGRTGASVE